MALLSPNQIHEVLQASKSERKETSDSLDDLLNQNNLSKAEILESLRDLMRLGETDSVKLQATKLAVELQRMIEKDSAPNFQCTIVINDTYGKMINVNPILIPRDTTL